MDLFRYLDIRVDQMNYPLSWRISTMTDSRFLNQLSATLAQIEADGLMKRERLIEGAQGAHVTIGGRRMLNLCANNYLGLADDPRLVAAAEAAMASHGYGMAAVRFMVGAARARAR
jgi:glycine C-acetyltransferase